MTDLDLFDSADDHDPSDTIGFLDFHGSLVPVLVADQHRWPSVTRLCQAMGIDPEAQRKAILRKHWAQSMTSVVEVMLPGQPRAYPNFFLHEKRVPMWLANIETDRLADHAVRQRVEVAQVEFADVLAEWVTTGQVKPAAPTLPAIPASYADALRQLADSVEARERQARALETAESAVRQLVPAATAWATFRDTGATLSVGVAAKCLAQHGVKTGRNRLYTELRGLGWVFLRSQEPTGRYVERGFVAVKPGEPYRHPKTGETTDGTAQTRITAPGLEWLAEHFGVALDHAVVAEFLDMKDEG